MQFFTQDIRLRTERRFQLKDITGEVKRIVAQSGVLNGIALVYSPHTTAAIRINEVDERLHQDMERFLSELSPPRGPYRHDLETVDDRPNAWGHLMSLVMDASATVPIHEGALELGGWQALFFVELDGPREDRLAYVRVIGE